MAKLVRNTKINKKPYIKIVGRVKRVEGQFLVVEFPWRDGKFINQTLWTSEWTKGGTGFIVGNNYKFFITLNDADGKCFFNVRSYTETTEELTGKTVLSGKIMSLADYGPHQIVNINGAKILNMYREFRFEEDDIGEEDEWDICVTTLPKLLWNGDVDLSDTFMGKDGKPRQRYYVQFKIYDPLDV